jgi:hypothetical protein
MGLTGPGSSISEHHPPPAVRRPGGAALSSGYKANRIHWVFSGVLLGLASRLLVLGVIFAVSGAWIVAGGLLAGMCGCLLAVWRAGRRLR